MAHVHGHSLSQYAQAAVKNVKLYLATKGMKLAARAKTPIRTTYRLEVDVSEELNPTDASYYQSLIGILLIYCKFTVWQERGASV